MNTYPFNAQPINDIATYNSVGAGLIALDGEALSMVAFAGQGEATILVQGTANATPATIGSGQGEIVLDPAGAPVIAVTGQGDAAIELTVQGDPQIAISAAGGAMVVVEGLYSIPASLPVPDAFEDAPTSRLIAVLSDNRVITVPLDRYALVRPVARVERIQKQARSA